MYLDEIAEIIESYIPEKVMPKQHSKELLRLYAVLLRAKGAYVTESDIHDAWAIWMLGQDDEHESLVPYEALPIATQKQDTVFVHAVKKAAKKLKYKSINLQNFEEVLFPFGPPEDLESKIQAAEQYKIMVSSSEELVNRRQGVNTFFLTINGALLTAYGLILNNVGVGQYSSLGIFILALAGSLLCGAWRSLIKSFGQLNSGKFKVINSIEKYLNTAIYTAEWEALERGENPKVYRSFTSREIWVPNALLGLHLLAGITAFIALVLFLLKANG